VAINFILRDEEGWRLVWDETYQRTDEFAEFGGVGQRWWLRGALMVTPELDSAKILKITWIG
jgi:hypothetical protein